ncbi:hypothetical protein V7S43_013144 [Phytophthora oleae]|uniref:Crinkler effector protein N-terminal domain-containing protein n=1 Tax=Phytophthora oleae TaxID=2107226 RepID=A0ABD3F790_9STRA
MMTLFCVIVGDVGSAFSVHMDKDQSVAELKEAVKVEIEDITSPTRDLQLFLAKKDGAWLSSTDPDVISLRRGTIPKPVEELLDDKLDHW